MDDLFVDMFGIKITEKGFFDEKQLPVFLRTEYKILQGEIEGVPCLLLRESGDLNLVQMKKHTQVFAKYTEAIVVFVLTHITDYQKKRLVELRVSFILPGKQLFLPFLGVVLHNERKTKKKQDTQISYAAQKVILLAFYEKWTTKTLTEIARTTGFSKMTISRCLDELEIAFPGCVSSEGKKRFLSLSIRNTMSEQYEYLKPYLRNPVRKVVSLIAYPDEVEGLPVGGFSALSEYTALADNPYRTYAIDKESFRQYNNVEEWVETPDGEEPKALLEIWDYLIFLNDKKLPDPISLAVSCEKRNDMDDRERIAVEKMLEESTW